jgi:hypothetical protein
MTFHGYARGVASCFAVLFAAAAQPALAQNKPLTPELQSVRKLLDKYNDPIVAVHDGFYSSVGCISYPNGGGEGAMKYAPGAMGVHFLNMANVGPKLDPAKPQVLIYEPNGDKLKLVAAEWFMPTEVAGGKAPTIFGQELGGPMEGHRPLMPDGLHHYDLHVWLWKTNPEGVFSPTNPAVKCPATGYSFTEAAPKMVHSQK